MAGRDRQRPAMSRMIAVTLWLAVLALSGAGQADAQRADQPRPVLPVVVIDFDRLFSESETGRSVLGEIEAERARLVAENQEIEDQLLAEEKELTEKRAELPPEEFRRLADAFDVKVEAMRRAQDAKAEALARRFEKARSDFLVSARPYLEQILVSAGALVMLERRNVILARGVVDVTDEAIALIDAGREDDSGGEEDATGQTDQ